MVVVVRLQGSIIFWKCMHTKDILSIRHIPVVFFGLIISINIHFRIGYDGSLRLPQTPDRFPSVAMTTANRSTDGNAKAFPPRRPRKRGLQPSVNQRKTRRHREELATKRPQRLNHYNICHWQSSQNEATPIAMRWKWMMMKRPPTNLNQKAQVT